MTDKTPLTPIIQATAVQSPIAPNALLYSIPDPLSGMGKSIVPIQKTVRYLDEPS